MLRAAGVSLEQLLVAREERAGRQAAALAHFDRPLVSLTIVMPGPVKDGALPRRVLAQALHALEGSLRGRRWRVLSRQVLWRNTGPEALYVVDADAGLLKSAALELEDQHPWGRLWDLDVIAPGPRILSRKDLGFAARRCLVCERPAVECGRSRRHPPEELLGAIRQLANADYLGSAA